LDGARGGRARGRRGIEGRRKEGGRRGQEENVRLRKGLVGSSKGEEEGTRGRKAQIF
jgi:hypothetical protein